MPTDPETGLPYPKMQTWVASQVPYLIRQAATKAGFRHNSEWVRDRIARALALELEGHEDHESFEEIMASMPKNWESSPGFVKLEKRSVQSGNGG